MKEENTVINNLHNLLDFDARKFISAEVELKNKLHGWITMAGSLKLKTVLQKYLNCVQQHVQKMEAFYEVEKIISEHGNKFVYLKDKELKLITVKAIEPTIEKNIEWYYVNGVLTYSETNWFDIQSKKLVKHEKQYLNNGHLIAWVNPENKLVDNASSEFKNLDAELNAYGVKLKSHALK